MMFLTVCMDEIHQYLAFFVIVQVFYSSLGDNIHIFQFLRDEQPFYSTRASLKRSKNVCIPRVEFVFCPYEFREYRPHRNSKCYFEGYFFIEKEMLLVFRGIYNFPMAVA